MLRSAQNRFATAATFASSGIRSGALFLVVLCLVLVALPVDAGAASTTGAKPKGDGHGKVDGHGKADAHGKGGTDPGDPDAPEAEEEDAAVVLRRQEIPETSDEIVRLYLARNDDLVRLQGCRRRPTGCTPGVQQAMLIRLEQAKELMDALEQRARKRKDMRAAMWRGRFAFENGVRMANSAIDVTDPQHRDVVVHMRSRARREFKIASDWLSAPSAVGDPDACWYLGRVWGEGLSGTRDPDIAAKLFRCAAIGYRVRGDLAAAVQSFQRLTKLVDPRHPMAAEVYARVWADDSRSAKGRSHGASGDHH
jgi:hypothetical protein